MWKKLCFKVWLFHGKLLLLQAEIWTEILFFPRNEL